MIPPEDARSFVLGAHGIVPSPLMPIDESFRFVESNQLPPMAESNGLAVIPDGHGVEVRSHLGVMLTGTDRGGTEGSVGRGSRQ